MNTRGVALFFVLAILFMVMMLANLVLNLINSQSRLTNHQVRRIQAYYAAQAGTNYAFEQLRLGNNTWLTNSSSSKSFRICGGNYSAANPSLCSGNNLTEPSFPPLINYVNITVGPLGSLRPINATVNYTAE